MTKYKPRERLIYAISCSHRTLGYPTTTALTWFGSSFRPRFHRWPARCLASGPWKCLYYGGSLTNPRPRDQWNLWRYSFKKGNEVYFCKRKLPVYKSGGVSLEERQRFTRTLPPMPFRLQPAKHTALQLFRLPLGQHQNLMPSAGLAQKCR